MDTAQPAVGLPVPPSPLVGRAGELARSSALLREVRLLTLVGTGGAGKTRLAIAVAGVVRDAHPDGVSFVDLAPLTDPAAVLPAVARALGLREAGAQPLMVTLNEHLSTRRVLVVLDNMEHVLAATTDVADLLARCGGLRVLATSRAALQIPGEQLFPVEPLLVPDARALPSVALLADMASVALFVARVQASRPDFVLTEANSRTVAEICIRLDGLPLALELAAARVAAFGLEELLAGIRGRFSLLELPRRAVPARHRTLAGAIRWSVELLDEPAQRLFRRLSVFAGGATPDAVRAVCGDDALPVLGELVDQSLVVATTTVTGVRYRMLETLREYAGDLLRAAGEQEDLRRRHLQWCVELAERVDASFSWPDEALWLDRAEDEFDNLREALDGCQSGVGVEPGLRIASGLSWFCDIRGYLGLGRSHLERLLARPEAKAVPPVLRARALDAFGRLSLYQDEDPVAVAALRESVALSKRAGDLNRAAWSTATIVVSAYMSGELDRAEAIGEWSVATARACGDVNTRARCAVALGMVRWAQQRRDEAWTLLEEGVTINPAPRAMWGRGRTLYFMGWLAYLEGDDPRAARMLRDGAELLRSIGDRRSFVDCLDVLACVAARTSDHVLALRLLTAGRRIRATTGARRHRYLAQQCAQAETIALAALPSAVADRITLEQLPLDRLLRNEAADVVPDGYTPREFEVAGLVAQGLTNRQIGRQLGISDRTVERHVENLRGKLGVRTRAQVAAWVAALPTPGT